MSTRIEIKTDNAPTAIGPYSQAIRRGPWVYCSGQIAIDPASGNLVDDTVADETHQVMKNLSELLSAAGCSFADVVMTTIFLKDMEDFGTVNAIYASYLEPPYPARATVAVASLPKYVSVEISMVAASD